MRLLLAHTASRSNVPINLVMIGRDGRPRQKGLREIIDEWIEFRFDDRHAAHAASGWSKVDDRIHILEGREIVLLNIDKVIKIIRNSDEPKAGADRSVQADRAPGRGHPRDPPAPAGAPRSASRSSRSWPSCARRRTSWRTSSAQSVDDEAHDRPGDRGRRQAVRRRAPHADRRSAEARERRAAGRRRAGHGHRLGERLGARAHRHRPRPGAVHLQGGRLRCYGAFECRTVDTLVGDRRQRQGLFGAGGGPAVARAATACRSRPWSTCPAACASCTTSPAMPTRACCWPPRTASASSRRRATWSAA